MVSPKEFRLIWHIKTLRTATLTAYYLLLADQTIFMPNPANRQMVNTNRIIEEIEQQFLI